MPIAIIVFQYLLIRSVDCSNRDLLESYARSTILGSCNCSTATTWLSHVLDRFPQKGRPSHLRKPQLRTRLRGVPAHLGDLGWWQSSQLFLIGKNKNNTNPDRYRTLKSLGSAVNQKETPTCKNAEPNRAELDPKSVPSCSKWTGKCKTCASFSLSGRSGTTARWEVPSEIAKSFEISA